MTTTTTLNDHCRVAIDDRGVARLTICNAGSMTLFNTPVITAVQSAIQTLAQRPGLRVLVLAGDSEKAFVGGADINELVTLNQTTGEQFITRLRDACEAVRLFPAPVIARIPGWCIGGGLEFAAACDFRVASEISNYSMPEVKIGIPSVIHAAMLPKLIGSSRARWLVLTGATVDAPTALDWGLVDVMAPPAQLDAEIEKLVAMLLECGAEALTAQKHLLRLWDDLPLTEAVNASIPIFGQAFLTGEPQHHMQQFLNRKRAAKP